MSLSEQDRDVLWSAVYAVVMAYEQGHWPLDRAKDVIEVILVDQVPLPDRDGS